MPPSTPLPRSRSSLTVGSAVGIPSSSSASFSSRFTSKSSGSSSTATASSSSGPPSVDDIDSDWELTENPSAAKPRKVLNMAAPLVEKRHPSTPKPLPGRARLPSTLTRKDAAGGSELRKARAGGGPEEATDDDRVLVCVRMKPPLPTSSIYDCSAEDNTISLGAEHPSNKKRGVIKGREQESDFSVDHLHLPPAPTEELFNKVVSPLVTAAMDGFDGTVFAYGMTGSGKTYTMGGVPDDPGVIPRAIDQIFDVIDSDPTRETTLRVSYLELYNENFRDLLNPTAIIPPSVHEVKGRIVVREVQDHTVRNPEDVQKLIKIGDANRRSGKTDWNEFSSRSHSIFTITIESRPLRVEGSTEAATGPTQFSRLNLIDLAGSERAATDVDRLKEGSYINKSLLVLGNVIEKLTESKPASHIPYRNSKLTRLLQDSLSGHARIAVICTVSFDEAHASEALATLKFARRASRVVTKAERGTVPSDKSMMQMYQDQVAQLTAELAKANELAALAARRAPALRDSPNPQENSDSEDEGELLEEERARLRIVQEEKAKAEQEVYTLELKRTKLRSEITTLSEFTLRSEHYVGPSIGGAPQTLSTSRRRRISDVQSIGLGRGLPSSLPGGAAQRRHASALGVVDEDGSGHVGRERRGDGMLGLGMAAVKEEGPSPKEQALEAELAEVRAHLADLLATQTSRTADHDAAVAAFESQIASLGADLAALSKEREQGAAEMVKLQKDLDAATAGREQSTQQLADLESRIFELDRQRQSDKTLLVTHAGTTSSQQTRAEEQEDAVAHLQSRLAELNARHESKELSAQAQAASLSTLEDTVASLRAQMREQDDQVAALKEQVVDATAARDASAREAASAQAALRAEVDSLTSGLAELEQRRLNETDLFKKDVARIEGERDTLIATTQPSDVVQIRISSLEDQLASQASTHALQVSALETQVEEAVIALATAASSDRVRTEELERQLHAEQQGRATAIEAETASLRAQIEEAQRAEVARTATMTEEIVALRSQLDESRREKEAASESAEMDKVALRSQLEASQQEQASTAVLSAQELDTLRSQLDKTRSIQTAQEEASAAQVAGLETQLESSRSSEAATSATVADLTRRLSDATGALVTLADSREKDMTTKFTQLESELTIKTQRVESLEKELLELARAIETTSPPIEARRGIPPSPSIAEGLNLRLPCTPPARMEAVSEDKEEVAHLRETLVARDSEIVGLREILDGWKPTLDRQSEIIHLLLNGVPASSISFANLATAFPSTSTLSSLSPSTPPHSQPSISSSSSTFDHTPLRKINNKPIAALAESVSADNQQPRPSLPSTPTGSVHNRSEWMSGSPKPPPLPHAGHQRSNSAARAARRVTIENDLTKLKGASRVELSRNIFNSPTPAQAAAPRTPVATRKV